MRIIGYKKSSFDGNNGEKVTGYIVQLAYVIDRDNGFGFSPLKKQFWLSSAKFKEYGVEQIAHDAIDIEPVLNIYGKLAGFTINK